MQVVDKHGDPQLTQYIEDMLQEQASGLWSAPRCGVSAGPALAATRSAPQHERHAVRALRFVLCCMLCGALCQELSLLTE